MPKFTRWVEVDADADVSVDDFLSECSSSDIDDIIKALVEDGYLPKHVSNAYNKVGPSEEFFEDALNKLHGKWNCLSKEEEELIINISKRF